MKTETTVSISIKQHMKTKRTLTKKTTKPITVEITDYEDNSVDFRVFVDGQLFTHKENLSQSRAAVEIGAAVMEVEE